MGIDCVLSTEVEDNMFRVYFQIVNTNIPARKELIYEYPLEETDVDDMCKVDLYEKR